MRSTTGDEIQGFLLRFESLFSRENLFASEQTNITEFFSKGWYTCRVHEHCPIFKTPHPPCPSTSKILPPLWPWMCNFKWTTPLQIITSQLKENIIQGWLLYAIKSFLQVGYRFQYQFIILSGFPLTSLHLSEASLFAFLWLHTLVCAVVQRSKCLLFIIIYSFSTQFAINLFYLQNVNKLWKNNHTCMWRNKIKTKTKPSHAKFKLITRYIVQFRPQTM